MCGFLIGKRLELGKVLCVVRREVERKFSAWSEYWREWSGKIWFGVNFGDIGAKFSAFERICEFQERKLFVSSEFVSFRSENYLYRVDLLILRVKNLN